MSRRTCEHIQDDGERCSNPAMYRRQVCYHHWRLLRPNAPVCDPAYVPPTFDCEASISLTTAHLLRCVLAGKIDLKRTGLIDVGTGALARGPQRAERDGVVTRATRAQLAVLPEESTILDAARPRAASTTADANSPAAAAAPEDSPWREPWVSITTTTPAPAGATDSAKEPPLSATQTKLLKKILRRGPKHPQFHLATRLLDRRIATNSA